jgi:plasmid rolling circle replication initiator protein Rep
MENCSNADVKSNLTQMLKAWDKFLKRRPIKRAVKGYCRSLEVTYNKKENTYHPHIHALLVVDSNYFTGKDYLSHDYLKQTWRECLDVSYDPIVDIRKVKRKNNTTSITAGATVETLKYSLKILPPDITTETVICLDEALRNRRLLSFGGVVAEVRTLLRMEDIEDSTLTDGDDTHNEYDCLYIFGINGWSVVDQAVNTVTGELTPLF